MADAHDLVSAVKQLAIELDRSPLKREFINHFAGADYGLKKHFNGQYVLLLQAAGLETYSDRRSPGKRKIGNEPFERDIAETLSHHIPKAVSSQPKDFKPILIAGDTHFPFAHTPTLEKFHAFAEKHQPAYIVQIGDLLDQWSHGRFPRSLNYYKPDEEMELGRKQAVEFWERLRKSCPKAQCYQILGNHDLRAIKQVLQNAPTLEGLISGSIAKLYEFEGVTTIHDYREELIIQDIMFHHGYMTRHGQQRDFVQQNLVSGHTHRPAVVFRHLKDKSIWHLDVGYLGDPESKALSYTSQKTTGWGLAWGWIDESGPRVVLP